MSKVEISITRECMDLLAELQSNMDGTPSFSDVIIGMDKTIEILTGQIADFKQRDPAGYASLASLVRK